MNKPIRLFNRATLEARGSRMIYSHVRSKFDHQLGMHVNEQIDIHLGLLNTEDLNFLSKYGISEEATKLNRMFTKLKLINHRKGTSWTAEKGNRTYCFLSDNGWLQHYDMTPNSSFKFASYGDNTRAKPFGWGSIEQMPNTEFVALTSGFKEVLMLHSVGVAAIKPPSETAGLGEFKDFVQMLKADGKKLIVLFDADLAGQNSSEDLAIDLEIPRLNLLTIPKCNQHYEEGKMKDLADFVAAGIISIEKDIIPLAKKLMENGDMGIKILSEIGSLMENMEEKNEKFRKEILEEENRFKQSKPTQGETVQITGSFLDNILNPKGLCDE